MNTDLITIPFQGDSSKKTNGLMPGTYVYIYEYAGSNLQDVQ